MNCDYFSEVYIHEHERKFNSLRSPVIMSQYQQFSNKPRPQENQRFLVATIVSICIIYGIMTDGVDVAMFIEQTFDRQPDWSL